MNDIDDAWHRYQVTWASPHAMLFMFADASGKTHSMTRRLLERMMHGGTLRLVSGQAVSSFGDGVALVALTLLVINTTHSVTRLAWFAAELLHPRQEDRTDPTMFSFFHGYRLPRRQVEELRVE